MSITKLFIIVLGVALSVPLVAQSGQIVDVVPVITRNTARSRILPGEFLPYQGVALYARVTGYVQDVRVDRGSVVKRGQTLVTIEAPELIAQRAEAEAKVATSRAQQAEAQAKLVAAQNTYDALKMAAATVGAVAENELVQAQKAVEAQQALVTSIESQVTAATAAVTAVRQLEAYLTITAPFDGVITERNVHPGALVGPQAAGSPPLLKLEQNRRLRLVVPVPETDVAGITRGADVMFTVPAYPSVIFHGTLARIAVSLDPKTRTMAVELDVMNPDGRLASGMYPAVRWSVSRPTASLFVPRTSIVTTTERRFVIRVRGGKTEWVDVRRGGGDQDLTEIFGDVKAGDEVVARASDELRAGTSVTPRRVAVKAS